ncbi:DNA recombination protein RmuC [Candidatus Falkowbacteria bacterium]|nr:DNA recombination protein RmuC [Candidatus Falkowbacteria bacterium]
MLNLFVSILLTVTVLLLLVVIYILIKKRGGHDGEKLATMLERLSNLSSQNEELRKALDSKLSEAHRSNQDTLGKTAGLAQNIGAQANKVIAEVSERLAKLDETNKQVVDFSSQLKNLQDILKNPKQRGVLGEYFLEETLKNVLPPNSYEMQYNFGKSKAGGDLIVDAVVKVKDKLIPVDSKFSLENYERILNANEKEEREKLEKAFKQDLKNRIDETSKYILPERGTMDFAFMFIPSESIYYDLLVNSVGAVKVNTRDLIEYAFREKRVIIVSPTSFLAYLQTVLQGLRAMQIEEAAVEIKKNIEKLSRHLLSYEDYMKKIGATLGTTVSHYNNAYKEFKKIDKDVVKITEGESKIEPLELEKPRSEY